MIAEVLQMAPQSLERGLLKSRMCGSVRNKAQEEAVSISHTFYLPLCNNKGDKAGANVLHTTATLHVEAVFSKFLENPFIFTCQMNFITNTDI